MLCIKSPVLASVLNTKSKVLFNFQATLDALGKLGFTCAAVWVLILQKHHKATPWISNRTSLSSVSPGENDDTQLNTSTVKQSQPPLTVNPRDEPQLVQLPAAERVTGNVRCSDLFCVCRM